ncbi:MULTISPECIES: pentapeptide repeat-containing protein [Synechococcales]|uniref:pentapeptide repeat-containing protein n=1 Tax=Synechococcus sp. CS-1325 TaxID=2847979 RepID=UPI00223BF4E3|nr:pentapeptide repeat-containing protein [Synechococcus sp. CS-1325]
MIPATAPPARLPLPGLIGLASLVLLLPAAALAADSQALIRLLSTKRCEQCRLADADLVQADLRDAELNGAQLQRANLSGARLDGARLAGADLSFTSLQGASLRGADLRGARLLGTDLRDADLGGALLDASALASSHWQGARGIDPAQQSYATLHNAGVDAATRGRFPEAEQFFSAAIGRQPEAAISWVARGISRSEQGNTAAAAQDFTYAAGLYAQEGQIDTSKQLKEAALQLDATPDKGKGGNGLGPQILSGTMGVLQFLAPLAIKAFVPLAF